jgi:hypothetical protein
MLYSQGIALESLGIPRSDGGATENDHRKVWRIVCENWHLFTGTPTGIWLRDELREVFGIELEPFSRALELRLTGTLAKPHWSFAAGQEVPRYERVQPPAVESPGAAAPAATVTPPVEPTPEAIPPQTP